MIRRILDRLDALLPYTRRVRFTDDELTYFVVYRQVGRRVFDVDGFVIGVAGGGRPSERADRWHRFRALAEAEA